MNDRIDETLFATLALLFDLLSCKQSAFESKQDTWLDSRGRKEMWATLIRRLNDSRTQFDHQATFIVVHPTRPSRHSCCQFHRAAS